jgi:hypothetical protein
MEGGNDTDQDSSVMRFRHQGNAGVGQVLVEKRLGVTIDQAHFRRPVLMADRYLVTLEANEVIDRFAAAHDTDGVAWPEAFGRRIFGPGHAFGDGNHDAAAIRFVCDFELAQHWVSKKPFAVPTWNGIFFALNRIQRHSLAEVPRCATAPREGDEQRHRLKEWNDE